MKITLPDMFRLPLGSAVLAAVLAMAPGGEARAHPHVWIDGGVDLVFGGGAALEALEVTWLYDAFETLYILSSHGLSLNDDGGLDEADRLVLLDRLSDWPEDFDGSAHLSVAGEPIPLAWPTGLDVRLRDGRLEMTFTRRLETPLDLAGAEAEVAFYESTHFFDFTITQPPRMKGGAGCATEVIPFQPDGGLASLQATLAALSREETPQIENVGALFADRIEITCG